MSERLSPEAFVKLFRYLGLLKGEVTRVVNAGLKDGSITVPPPRITSSFHAGGTNMCPNSDFAFSKLAATVENTQPSDAAADNQRVYRVFYQANEANISANLVEATPASTFFPTWDKVRGTIQIGSKDIADPNNDIAIQFTNNWLVPNRKWYVRVAVALKDATELPIGTRLFAGFWVKRAASQEWVSGDTFQLTSKVIGTAGTRSFNYKVIAKTDTGRTIESAVLNVTNVPTTLGGLSTDNKVQITYPGALGFIEFLLYRQDVSSGRVDLIAWDRNSTKLFAYDTGQSLHIQEGGFPSAPVSSYRAYEELDIDAVDIAVRKTFHNFVINIPANFDTSTVIREGTYLRIGVLGNTAIDAQVVVDTVWASESYNVWSACPFDSYPSQPSTTMLDGPPGGGPVDEPPETGNTCVWDQHDLAIPEGWCKLEEATPGSEVDTPNGVNVIKEFIEGEVSQYFKVTFDCGLIILCTPLHRFLRSFDDSSGIMVRSLSVGDKVQGAFADSAKGLVITNLELCTGQLKVRTPVMTSRSKNRYFAVGDRTTGWRVWCHNEKQQ